MAIAKLWPGDRDRVRVHETARQAVIELAISGGPPTVLARDVAAVAAGDAQLAVAGAGAVRIVDSGGERVVARYAGVHPGAIAIAPDGARVAAAFRDEIIEWDVATGKRIARWPGAGPPLLYAGARLYGANRRRNGQLDALAGSGTHQALTADWSVLWSTAAGARTALVHPSGELALLDDAGSRVFRLDQPGTRMVAGRPGSPYLVAGSTDGTIRWWDLRHLLPESHRVPSGALCAIDPQRIYVRRPGSVAIVPRAGGDTTSVDSPGMWCLAGHAGNRVVATGVPSDGEPTFDVIDGATARAQRFTGEPLLGGHGIYFVRGRTLFALHDDRPMALWTAPAQIIAAAATGRELALQIAGGELVRFDPATRATTAFDPVASPSVFQLALDGTWWYAAGARVYHGDREIGELPSPVRALWLAPGGDCMALAADRTIWRAGPRRLDRAIAGSAAQVIATGTRAIATLGYGVVRLLYADTGEQLSIPVHDAADVQLFDDDRLLAIVRTGGANAIDLVRDPVPTDPALLAGWLSTATNAVIEPGSATLTWR